SVAEFSGTMKGPLKTAEGKAIQPTAKSFRVEFCTVAAWNEKGEITEERLFYDLVGLMRQIGLARGGVPAHASSTRPYLWASGTMPHPPKRVANPDRGDGALSKVPVVQFRDGVRFGAQTGLRRGGQSRDH